jgi:hypothetical protein
MNAPPAMTFNEEVYAIMEAYDVSLKVVYESQLLRELQRYRERGEDIDFPLNISIEGESETDGVEDGNQ